MTRQIMLVGEAYGEQEAKAGRPFVGAAGKQLDGWLEAVGLQRKDCVITNVVNKRPPKNNFEAFSLEDVREGEEKLRQLIDQVKPDTIVALGNVPLQSLTGEKGISNWRGSMLAYGQHKLLPTFHPAGVMRQWAWRPIAIHDLRKVVKWQGRPWPTREENFLIDPTPAEAQAWLAERPMACDLETKHGEIACIGFARSETEAMCIPWYVGDKKVVHPLMKHTVRNWLREHKVIGQNFLYDNQYLHHEFEFTVGVLHDTMIQHHVLHPGMEKSLGYLSSLYLEPHKYWKGVKNKAEDYEYNCRDCCITYALSGILSDMLVREGLWEVYEFQLRLAEAALRTMLRGIRVDRARSKDLQEELRGARESREALFEAFRAKEPDIIGPRGGVKKTAPWWTSDKKLKEVLYGEWRLPKQHSRKTGNISADDEALERLKKHCKQEWQADLLQALQEYRSLKRFMDFLKSPVDPDGRMRCSFNPAGTSTFRFSSSENAFGRGTNLQNISKGTG